MTNQGVVVGVYGNAHDIPEDGAVYVFTRTIDGWSESQKIVANDGSRGDHFGWDVAIDQKTIIVGSFKNALYVFDVNDRVEPDPKDYICR